MIKVSVVIAAYATPAEGLERVIRSLDAQTLPHDEFEVVFVDDGSPDDTLARLQTLATARPWMRVYTIPNSGWGSAPRNEGTRHACGEYVLYMDHDDSLYPDALRGLWEFAHANNSDLVSPKESKTNDSWWGLNGMLLGNTANLLPSHQISGIIPMVPHKLYRRQMLVDNRITFPEGSRVLWEDQFFNIEAYAHSKVVSVQADHPVYLWHASSTNSSHTFHPSRPDFWEMLEKLLEFTNEQLDGHRFQPEREFMLAQQTRLRIIDRTARYLSSEGSRARQDFAFLKARHLLAKFSSRRLERRLPQKHRVQARLLRRGRKELFVLHHQSDVARSARLTATSVRWEGSTAVIPVQFSWFPRDPLVPAFKQEKGRIVLGVPTRVERAVPASEWDVTDDVAHMELRVVARERRRHISWTLPAQIDSVGYREVRGVGQLVGEATIRLDLEQAQVGEPLEPGVWDLRWSLLFAGMERINAVAYEGPVEPVAASGQVGSAYRNAKGDLTIDTSGTLRTVVVDAQPRVGRVDEAGRWLIPLDRIALSGSTDQPAGLYAVPAEQVTQKMRPADGVDLEARLVADPRGARIEAAGEGLDAGEYRLCALRNGVVYPTRYLIHATPEAVSLSAI